MQQTAENIRQKPTEKKIIHADLLLGSHTKF